MSLATTQKITGTSPAAASTAVLSGAATASQLDKYDAFTVVADLVGATGGTLDVYVQRRLLLADGTSVWVDWIHFPQLAAGAAAVRYTVAPVANNTIVATGLNGTPALASNTCTGGHPGLECRVICTAGASTSAGAAVTVYITGWQANR